MIGRTAVIIGTSVFGIANAVSVLTPTATATSATAVREKMFADRGSEGVSSNFKTDTTKTDTTTINDPIIIRGYGWVMFDGKGCPYESCENETGFLYSVKYLKVKDFKKRITDSAEVYRADALKLANANLERGLVWLSFERIFNKADSTDPILVLDGTRVRGGWDDRHLFPDESYRMNQKNRLNVNPKQIKRVMFVKAPELTKKYGPEAERRGVVIIQTK